MNEQKQFMDDMVGDCNMPECETKREYGSLDKTLEWFAAAVPNPNDKNKVVQLGCHVEEIAEMLHALQPRSDLVIVTSRYADTLKNATDADAIQSCNKAELLDALCDQLVTICGVGYMLGFDMVGALAEVNRSNFSKFENSKPVFNEQGKIAKGKHYSKPDLKPFLGE